MTSVHLQRVEEIFHAALDSEPDQLKTLLDEKCAGDEVLRREVEALLALHQKAGNFIETPVANIANGSIAEDDETDLLIGQTIGHYKIVKQIDRGGMGAVYLAERADDQYKKRVAIKLIKRGMDTDSVLRHFRNERQILANFDHPNVAHVLDGGATDEGLPYFVMEYVEGLPIDRYCQQHGLSIAERLKLFCQVCTAVAYAHRRAVMHRDIKPSNVLVTNDGTPKLLDFGIAKILQPHEGVETLATITGVRLMTPEYASPEQVRGESVTAATDIYSLGVVLYQLLTGQKPYRLKTRTSEEISRAILEQEPTRPSTAISRSNGSYKSQIRNAKILRGDLDNIVLTALRKEPQRRYQTVEQFSEDIRRHLEGLPVQARKDTLIYRGGKFIRRNSTLVAASTACFLLALAVAWLLRQQFPASSKAAAPEKSIAVLPFENLSKDQENAYFADGVQDEILTSLSRVSDLKVISRTSMMQYKDAAKRNLRHIGQQLGVANVVEGSVQRTANRIRVNAQLVDARNDTHLWAQTYDGDLTDVFGIQSRIAQAIANQLQARISAGEKAAIERPPTTDMVAYDLYRRALPLESSLQFRVKGTEAIRLLEQAVARDPNFYLAYCAMSRIHMVLYFGGADHTLARRELANAAIEKAATIQPDAAEVHLAKARYWFQGFYDYDRARAEMELARRGLPNDPQIYYLTAAMDRRQGRWSEALRNFEHAAELKPRDADALLNTAFTYHGLHRYAEATRFFERAAALDPHDYFARLAARTWQPLDERGDIQPLRYELDAMLAENPKSASEIADDLWNCAVLERNRVAIERALDLIPAEGMQLQSNFVRPREEYVGYAARMFGDQAKATRAYTAARRILQKEVEEQPEYAAAWSFLGRVDAALGRKEEAIREGRRACELLPLSKDAWSGPGQLRSLAKIYACTGEKNLALATLEQLLSNQISDIHYGDLKLDPDWDPLRGDPRFEKVVASLAPQKNTGAPEKSIAVLPFEITQ